MMSFNYLSIVIAVVGYFAICMIWFGEKGFGKAWAMASGFKSVADMRKSFAKNNPNMGLAMAKIMGVQLLTILSKILLLSMLLALPNGMTLVIVFLATVFLTETSGAMWQDKSCAYWAINVFGDFVPNVYLLVVYSLIGPYVLMG